MEYFPDNFPVNDPHDETKCTVLLYNLGCFTIGKLHNLSGWVLGESESGYSQSVLVCDNALSRSHYYSTVDCRY